MAHIVYAATKSKYSVNLSKSKFFYAYMCFNFSKNIMAARMNDDTNAHNRIFFMHNVVFFSLEMNSARITDRKEKKHIWYSLYCKNRICGRKMYCLYAII